MTFIQENASLILLHGCSLVEDSLKTSIISDCAARLHLMQTRNFQLLNTWHEKPSNQLSLSDSENEKN